LQMTCKLTAGSIVVSMLAAAGSASVALAEEVPGDALSICRSTSDRPPNQHLAFAELPQSATSTGLRPKIGNGKEQDRKDWPASLWGGTAEPPPLDRFAENLACSATLIGPRVLLTAAHCIADRGTVSVYHDGQKIADGTCDQAPGWKSRRFAGGEDWALCLMNLEMPVPAGSDGRSKGFEVVAVGVSIRANDSLQLTGFGCDENFRTDGRFIAGGATIATAPSSEAAYAATPFYQRGFSGPDAAAYVCEGDSGGADYMSFLNAGRRAVGVNSARALIDGRYASCSAILASDQGRKFVKDWLAEPEHKKKGAAICGVSPEARNCRQ
jgi:hypothetical protein